MDTKMTCRVGRLYVLMDDLTKVFGLSDLTADTSSEWSDDRVTMQWQFRDSTGARWTIYDWKGSAEYCEFSIGGDGFLCRPAEPDLFHRFLKTLLPDALITFC
jgi:hypothetical protein